MASKKYKFDTVIIDDPMCPSDAEVKALEAKRIEAAVNEAVKRLRETTAE